jgi:hypothetical protein
MLHSTPLEFALILRSGVVLALAAVASDEEYRNTHHHADHEADD